jgi:hypothetical protein
MALHSAQGPQLGLPQMISSRAQFGIIGAIIPLVLVVLMYIGFASTGAVLSGQAVNLIIGVETPWVGHRHLRRAHCPHGGPRLQVHSRPRPDLLGNRSAWLPLHHLQRVREDRRGRHHLRLGLRFPRVPLRDRPLRGMATDLRPLCGRLLTLPAAIDLLGEDLLVHVRWLGRRFAVVDDPRRSHRSRSHDRHRQHLHRESGGVRRRDRRRGCLCSAHLHRHP